MLGKMGKKKVQPAHESSIKEVFQWDGEDLGFTKRQIKEKQVSHCSKKFQSEQRDNYRYFVESPSKKEGTDGDEAGLVAGGTEDLVNDGGKLSGGEGGMMDGFEGGEDGAGN
jgi:hypothetical protein